MLQLKRLSFWRHHPRIHQSLLIQFRLRCFPCPILLGCVEHQLAIHLCLVRQHQLGHTSDFTHSDHVVRGLPFFLEPGSGPIVINLIQTEARCTWPCPLSYRQQRTDVMSYMPNSFSSEAVGVSSLMPRLWCQRSNGSWHGHCGGAATVRFLWSPRFATMEHSQKNTDLAHLATYPGWEVSGN